MLAALLNFTRPRSTSLIVLMRLQSHVIVFFSAIVNRRSLPQTVLCVLYTLRRRYTSYSAASEVSSILESKIAGTQIAVDVEETGRVLSMYSTILWTTFHLTIFSKVLATVLVVFGVLGMYRVNSIHEFTLSLLIQFYATNSRRDGGILLWYPWHVPELGSRQRRCFHLW